MTILDGKTMADWYINAVRIAVRAKEVKPQLAVLLVGDDPASRVYVRSKEKACEKCGIRSRVYRLPASATEGQVRGLISRLNNDDDVDGIIVQLPLPGHIPVSVVDDILMRKDVDGLSVRSMGALFVNDFAHRPCTPKGIIRLIDDYLEPGALHGANVAIIGRSRLVGRPLAVMMERRDATVTVCHSGTRDLRLITRRADVVVCAVGRPDFLTADMIKEGAIVIDVGINRVGGKLVGDCAADVAEKAGYYTPVPGGVGPMTVAMLMENTLEAYRMNREDV